MSARPVKRSADAVIQTVSEILYGADPMGCSCFGAPADEYLTEAETITRQLRLCRNLTPERAQNIISQEFVRMFWSGALDYYKEWPLLAETLAWVVNNPDFAPEYIRKLRF